MAKMKESELLAIVRAEKDATKNTTELASQRERAIKYYNGEPFGNEIEGQSQVVSTDVQETIEWIMPSLMRIFASTDKAVVFDPVDPMDDEGAKQETDIVNHTFYKENNGFLVLYSFMKDALLTKNGIVKFWWDDSEEKVREEYAGLGDQELLMLLDDENVNPVEHTQNEDGTFDIVVERTNSTGRVMVRPVPPEEFLISQDATSPDPCEANFVCHHTRKTRSDLIAMGMKKSFVNSLPADNSYYDDEEKLARDDLDQFNESSRVEYVEYDECYMKVDFDGDGIDELRQVTLVGNKIAQFKDGKGNVAVDAIPFASITPIILTHKFYGMSVADTVMDLQLIKSTLLRGILDNTYQTNNPRTAVQDGMVNLDDLLTNRPGGVVRTEDNPAAVIMPMPVAALPQQTFQVWGELESIRKGRTGVGQDTMGLESNVLAHGKTGVVDQSFDMARMRIELIARVFAETGIKQMFLGVHRLLQQNQNKKKWFKIRGEWIEVDPSQWKTRSLMTSRVGLGTGNKDRQVSTLMAIWAIQKELIQGGRGVTEANMFNTLDRLIEAGGYKDVNEFFTDPSTQPPPQPKPDPNELLIQAQIQLATSQAKVIAQEAATNQQEAIWKHEEKMLEIQTRAQTEQLKIQTQDTLKRTEMELDFQARTNEARNVPGAVV